MLRQLTILLASISLFGCASKAPTGVNSSASPSEKESYLKRVTTQSSTFNISASENSAAWSRALDFIKLYSAKQPVTKTESLIETPRNKIIGDFYYKVGRQTYGQNIQYSVDCQGQGMGMDQLALRNKGILIEYIKTGEMLYPNLVTK